MDIEEWYAIEEFKHGQVKRLVTWVAQQKGQPLSPLLHEFFLDLIQGKKFRTRGGQAKPSQASEIKLAIRFAEVVASLRTQLHGTPSSKKAILLDAAKATKLSLKHIERIAYRKTSGSHTK